MRPVFVSRMHHRHHGPVGPPLVGEWRDTMDPLLWSSFRYSGAVQDGTWVGAVMQSALHDGVSEIWPEADSANPFWIGFRPTKVRIFHNGAAANIAAWIYDSDWNTLAESDNAVGYPSGTELDITWTGNLDIAGVDLWNNPTGDPFEITKIEFYYDPNFIYVDPVSVQLTPVQYAHGTDPGVQVSSLGNTANHVVIQFSKALAVGTNLQLGTDVTVFNLNLGTSVSGCKLLKVDNQTWLLWRGGGVTPDYTTNDFWPAGFTEVVVHKEGILAADGGKLDWDTTGSFFDGIRAIPAITVNMTPNGTAYSLQTGSEAAGWSDPVPQDANAIGSFLIPADPITRTSDGKGLKLTLEGPRNYAINGQSMQLLFQDLTCRSNIILTSSKDDTFNGEAGALVAGVLGSPWRQSVDPSGPVTVDILPSDWLDLTTNFTVYSGFSAYNPAVGFALSSGTVGMLIPDATAAAKINGGSNAVYWWRFTWERPIAGSTFHSWLTGAQSLVQSGSTSTDQENLPSSMQYGPASTWAYLKFAGLSAGFVLKKIEVTVNPFTSDTMPKYF